MTGMTEIQMFILAILPIYVVAFVLYTLRALRGPSISDMVLAIDAMSYDLAAFLVILAIYFKQPILIPVAIALALWIYSLDIYVSKYLEGKELGE